MPNQLRMLDLNDFFVSLDGLAWSPKSRWSTQDFHYSETTLHQVKGLTLFSNQKIFHKDKKLIDQREAAWILTSLEDQRKQLGFAYFQGLERSRHSQGFIFLELHPSLEESVKVRLVGFLISLIFSVTQYDILKMYAATDSPLLLSQFSEFSDIRHFYTINRYPWISGQKTPIKRLSCVIFSKGLWQKHFSNSDFTRQLKYIDARLKRIQNKESKDLQTKRTVFARIFRPRVGDSFF